MEMKADLTKTIENAYDDGLKKPLVSSSNAISTLLDFFNNTVLYPMQKYNLYAKDKLDKYALELQNQALVSIDKINSSIYHYWYDCYEDWPYEYVKDFVGWKIKALSQLSDCKECTRCKERDYRNAHPKAIITGYDFHYYFEDL